jgi:hypothetical protein
MPKFREQVAIETISQGITLGNVLAIVISWSLNKSILWACLHGCCSWFYIIYYATSLR